MSTFSSGKKVSVPDHWKEPLAWMLLVLAFAAGFAAGQLTAREDEATPIVIETRAGE